MQDVKIDRYKYIGGSDIPIIMNLSSFKTRFDLLLEKAQLKDDLFQGNEYTEYGNTMEPKIRQYINTFFHRNFKEDKLEKDDIRCHFDGICEDMILEIKTTSQIYESVNDYKVYLVQLLFYMMNANMKVGMLAVYNRPVDFNENFDDERLQTYIIELKDYRELSNEINEAVEQFRIDLKKVKDNPFLTEQQLINDSVMHLGNQVVKLEKQLQMYKQITKQYDELKIKLKEAMKKHNLKTWCTPQQTKITLIEDQPDKVVKKFNEEKFKLENEILYNKYLEDNVQKGKSGYVKITLGKGDQ